MNPMVRTFWKMHYDLLDSEEFRHFLMSPACVTFIIVLRHVFRGNRKHPRLTENHELHNFYWEGWLCCRPSIQQLRAHYPERSRRQVYADIATLEEMGLLDTYPWTEGGGTAQLIQVGSWFVAKHPGSSREQYTEVLYVDRIFSPLDYDEETGQFLP